MPGNILDQIDSTLDEHEAGCRDCARLQCTLCLADARQAGRTECCCGQARLDPADAHYDLDDDAPTQWHDPPEDEDGYIQWSGRSQSAARWMGEPNEVPDPPWVSPELWERQRYFVGMDLASDAPNVVHIGSGRAVIRGAEIGEVILDETHQFFYDGSLRDYAMPVDHVQGRRAYLDGSIGDLRGAQVHFGDPLPRTAEHIRQSFEGIQAAFQTTFETTIRVLQPIARLMRLLGLDPDPPQQRTHAADRTVSKLKAAGTRRTKKHARRRR